MIYLDLASAIEKVANTLAELGGNENMVEQLDEIYDELLDKGGYWNDII